MQDKPNADSSVQSESTQSTSATVLETGLARHLPLILFAIATTIFNLVLGFSLESRIGDDLFILTLIGTVLGQIVFYFVIAGLYGTSWLDGFLASCLLVAIAVALFITVVFHEDRAAAYASLLVLPAAIAVGSGPLLLMRHFFGWRIVAEAAPRIPSTLTNMFVGTLMAGTLLMTIRAPEVIWEFDGSSDYWIGAAIALTCLLIFGLLCAVPAAVATFSTSGKVAPRVIAATLSWIVLAIVILSAVGLTFGGNLEPDFILAVIGIWVVATFTVFGGLLVLRYAGYRLESNATTTAEFETEATQRFLQRYYRRTWIQVGLVLAVLLGINVYVAKLISKRAVLERSIAEIEGRVRELGGSVDHYRRKIHAIQLNRATDESLRMLLAELKTLELTPSQLNFNGSKITDASLTVIGDVSSIQNLRLAKTNVTGKGFRLLNKLPLYEIDLSGLTLTDADWENASWGSLSTLRLSDTKVASDSFASFLARSNIYTLEADGSDVDGESLMGITDQSHRDVALSLADTQITDDEYAKFHSNRISSLDLSGTQVTDRSLRLIGECERLHSLNLSDTAITDDGLSHFKWGRQHMTLNLSNTRITGQGFKSRPITYAHHLNVSNTLVNDETIKLIVGDQCPGNINLSGTRITDAALPALLNSPQVAYLTIKRTSITANGIVKSMPTARTFTIVVERNRFSPTEVAQIEAAGNRLVVE